MSKFTQIAKAAGVVAAVILIGIAVGWWGSRGGKTDVSIPAPPSQTPPPDIGQKDTNSSSFFTRNHPRPTAEISVPPMVTSPEATNLIANWEDKLDEILVGSEDEAEKAKKLVAMFPRLPEDGQVEVAQHLSNLVPDEDYASLEQFLTNSTLPEAVLDSLLADALNRPNSIKLPALLSVARDGQNPKAGEAKDVLALFLEDDYGTDWNAWQTKLDQWLKDNPD
jgi:hypothetical protein